jgi:hypothetical protein
MPPQGFSFSPPPWTGEPKLIAELWTLYKWPRRALCTLWNHPDGAELRLDVEGRDSTTYADSDIERLVTIAEDWRKELIESVGWKDMRPKP